MKERVPIQLELRLTRVRLKNLWLKVQILWSDLQLSYWRTRNELNAKYIEEHRDELIRLGRAREVIAHDERKDAA